MRPNALVRTLVGATAVVGLAAGGLATAGTSAAASQRPASSQSVTVKAVNNLGLNTTQAKHWQCWLDGWGFDPGTIDGKLGTDSWKAAQRFFNHYHEYVNGPLVVDGVVGRETIKALQHWLGVDIDGIAGPQTRAAFADFNNTNYC
ncbi:peptidoglycan-binding domain-containing protein [Streptomyces griseosporeus]|uniref:peptidoglycan-binding domain-containing protein n=1 Tax=Streptomyces griseosporeus TaxID=1910 RepID=UPI0037033734